MHSLPSNLRCSSYRFFFKFIQPFSQSERNKKDITFFLSWPVVQISAKQIFCHHSAPDRSSSRSFVPNSLLTHTETKYVFFYFGLNIIFYLENLKAICAASLQSIISRVLIQLVLPDWIRPNMFTHALSFQIMKPKGRVRSRLPRFPVSVKVEATEESTPLEEVSEIGKTSPSIFQFQPRLDATMRATILSSQVQQGTQIKLKPIEDYSQI